MWLDGILYSHIILKHHVIHLEQHYKNHGRNKYYIYYVILHIKRGESDMVGLYLHNVWLQVNIQAWSMQYHSKAGAREDNYPLPIVKWLFFATSAGVEEGLQHRHFSAWTYYKIGSSTCMETAQSRSPVLSHEAWQLWFIWTTPSPKLQLLLTFPTIPTSPHPRTTSSCPTHLSTTWKFRWDIQWQNGGPPCSC